MALTAKQYNAFKELYRRGSLSPERKTAFEKLKERGAFKAFDPLEEPTTDPRVSTIGGPESPGTMPEIEPAFGSVEEAAKAGVSAAMPYARPVIEAGASVGTALLAAPTTPAGMAVAGGIGYGAGATAADIIEKWAGSPSRKQPETWQGQLAKGAEDIAFGTTMEMGGQLIAKGLTEGAKMGLNAISKIGKKLPKAPLSKSSAMREAKNIYAAQTGEGPLIAQNVQEAKALEEAIPGLKFSRGQLTDDPGIIKFERARARMPGEVAQEQLELTASNNKAIKSFLDEQKGIAGIEDVTAPIAAERKALVIGAEEAAGALERETGGLAGGMGAVETGKTIRAAARAGKKEAQKQAGRLFEEIPEFDIDASSLISKIDELSAPLNKFEAVGKNVPEDFAQYKKVLEESGGVTTPQDLQSLRSSLTDSLRDAQGAASPNNRMISRLSKMIGEVDSVLIGAGEDVGSPAESLKTAQQFFKKEVIEKFKTGATGDILKKGAGGDKVSNAQIASRYFKPGNKGVEQAQQFIDSVGERPEAREAIEDYIKQDLLSSSINPVTAEISETKLKTWLSRYKPALKKLGLDNKFDNIVKVREELTKATDLKVAFDKSSASKLLDDDVDSVIKIAFASGQKRKAAERIMTKVGGDKKAVSGLQNATIDHIITNAETTAADAFGNPIVSLAKVENEYKKFSPALKVLFKDAPQKLEALDQYRKALMILQRGKASPIGGGSDTAENVITAMSKASGMTHSRALNVAKAIIKPIISMGDDQVNAILNRAAFDPDFAYTLKLASKGRPEKIINERMIGHIATLGIREASKPNKKEQ